MINKTIDEVFRDCLKKNPDKEFIIYSDRNLRWTYKEFDKRINNLAKGFLAIGIKKGDHVGLWGTNVPDWLAYMFALARIGSILVTINPAYKKFELEYIIKQSDMAAICLIDSWRDSNYIDILAEVVPEIKTSQRGHFTSETMPLLKNTIYMGSKKHRGMYNTQELILLGSQSDNSEIEAIAAELNCHETINMQYTSGTTGFPKGIQLTHYNILNNGYQVGECQKFTEKEKLCLPAPLFHCFGIVLGVLAILTHNATLVMIEEFDVLTTLASIQNEKCTALYGVPTMFIAELSHPMFDTFDLSTLRTGIMAGSPCPMDTMKQVVNKMNMSEVTIAYGLTETSPVMTQTRTDDSLKKKVSTVGRELPGIEVMVVNPETGEECAIEEQGELCCRGYNIMKGYYNMPAETEACIDKEGWLHSGDLGIKDAEGFFRVSGRIKDMIIRGGENIYPREIEEFLHPMPEIKDIKVAGVPDKKYGELVGAFIILHEGQTLTKGDVQRYCKGTIARHKIPKHVFFVDNYPLTTSGKVQKYKLGDIALDLLEKS